jgi:hypothetical protein
MCLPYKRGPSGAIQRGETHSFEVTPAMFDVIERMYEPPTQHELAEGTLVDGE